MNDKKAISENEKAVAEVLKSLPRSNSDDENKKVVIKVTICDPRKYF